MCGIMGYYAFGKVMPDKEKITNMFTALESRGTDASGFAYIRNNKLIVHKAPVSSSVLVKSKEWTDLDLPKIMIMHTRLKTKGDQKNNMNNHPLFTKDGLCIVHNGMIYNDDELFNKKTRRDAEVDSEAILTVLSKKRNNIKHLFDTIIGSYAVAVINKNHPYALTLIKKDNPIDLYFDECDDILYFCSERRIMRVALEIKQNHKRGFTLGEGCFHYFEIQNNHALDINNEGVDFYREYKPTSDTFLYDRRCDTIYDYIDGLVECPHCFGMTPYDPEMLNNSCYTCGNPITQDDLLEEDLYV